jgi:hypothetical protein
MNARVPLLVGAVHHGWLEAVAPIFVAGVFTALRSVGGERRRLLHGLDIDAIAIAIASRIVAHDATRRPLGEPARRQQGLGRPPARDVQRGCQPRRLVDASGPLSPS